MAAKIVVSTILWVDETTNKVDKIPFYSPFIRFICYFIFIYPPKRPLPYKNLDYCHNDG